MRRDERGESRSKRHHAKSSARARGASTSPRGSSLHVVQTFTRDGCPDRTERSRQAHNACIHAVRLVCTLVVWLGFLGRSAYSAHRIRRTFVARRWVEVLGVLVGAVSTGAAHRATQQGIRVRGVYVVGDEFHHGIFPKKEAQLTLLYPHRAQKVAQVALLPDATRARRAAAQFQRWGFSLQELLQIEQYEADRARGRVR
jgi:hypothetical protein